MCQKPSCPPHQCFQCGEELGWTSHSFWNTGLPSFDILEPHPQAQGHGPFSVLSPPSPSPVTILHPLRHHSCLVRIKETKAQRGGLSALRHTASSAQAIQIREMQKEAGISLPHCKSFAWGILRPREEKGLVGGHSQAWMGPGQYVCI